MHSCETISPISGWSLNLIVALDRIRPGTAGSFLRSSDERRQVVSAMLSERSEPRDSVEARNLAELITSASHDDLLAAAFDPVPIGLRRALARSGSQPHPRQYYHSLHRLLSSPQHGRIAEVIGQLDAIDHPRIRIMEILPDDFLSANLVRLIESVTVATDVSAIATLLTGRGADREALGRAIRAVSSPDQFSKLWERWAFKAQFPEHPIPQSPCYTPVRDGDELRKLSLRYRNCAKRYLPEALEGSSAFAEFTDSGSSVVVHLVRENDTWLVEGLFAKDNGSIRLTVRMSAMEYLASKAVLTRPQLRESRSEWDVLRRLTRTYFLDLDMG